MLKYERFMAYGLLFGVVLGGAAYKCRPLPYHGLNRHHHIVQELQQQKPDLIFIGDSITQNWEIAKTAWDEYYGNRNAVNMGIGWDTTTDVVWRLEHIDWTGVSPKLAVVLIGTNDKGTAERVGDGMIQVCMTLRQQLPNTKILLLSILPRSEPELNSRNQYALQRAARFLQNDPLLTVVDVNRSFLNLLGGPSLELYADSVHLNDKGYRVLAEALEPYIKQGMGELSGNPG